MIWLLGFTPLAIALHYLAPSHHGLIFITAAIAILPLAGWLGWATEQLADWSGEGVGGLLNATFGNAAELIIALAALRAGLHDVVKATIVGSIVGNILLVLGAAMLAGGLRYREQHAHALGLSNIFVGVFVIAILGNAAEHATAVTAAMKDRMDLSFRSPLDRAFRPRCSSLRCLSWRACSSGRSPWIFCSARV